jgi:hypothetical protein
MEQGVTGWVDGQGGGRQRLRQDLKERLLTPGAFVCAEPFSLSFVIKTIATFHSKTTE